MSEKIKVLYYALNESPEVIEIDNNLKAMQNLVGGFIECLDLSAFGGPKVDVVLNEEGKLYDMAPNRLLPNGDYIAGNFFVYGYPDQTGESTGIREDQIEEVKRFFDHYAINR